jgi:hypothetical protein|tara:strand:- start:355 stop:612 length:258 start_codon:yes stop_codon:yes gene_type:complete
MNTANKYKVGDHAIYVNNNKEQIITIDSIESNLKYKYYYGLEGFHEGYVQEKQLRDLSPNEQYLLNNKCYYELPRDFYDKPPFSD